MILNSANHHLRQIILLCRPIVCSSNLQPTSVKSTNTRQFKKCSNYSSEERLFYTNLFLNASNSKSHLLPNIGSTSSQQPLPYVQHTPVHQSSNFSTSSTYGFGNCPILHKKPQSNFKSLTHTNANFIRCNEILANRGHVLSKNNIDELKLTHVSNFSLSNAHLRMRMPGKTEYTKDAINIPKLILDASPNSVKPYLQMIRFDRPIGTWLLYWPCTWSIALAAQPGCWPDFYLIALFGAGAFFMRGAGCIINDMWDKDFDKQVERTMLRPIASGQVTYPQTFAFLASQLAISLAILLQLNWYSIALGVASLGIVVTYPTFKRFTYWPQVILGFAFNYGALLGWAAVRGYCDWSICLPLCFSCHMWTMIYDTIYAHQDISDDLLVGVKSTAIRFGDQTKLWLTGFTSLMAAGLLYVGDLTDMTWPYYAGSAISIASILTHLHHLDIKDPQACGDGFRLHFYIGLLMFISITMGNRLKDKGVINEDTEKEFLSVS